MAECQSARMSKITNDGLTRSGTGCFIAVPIGNSGHQRVNIERLELSSVNNTGEWFQSSDNGPTAHLAHLASVTLWMLSHRCLAEVDKPLKWRREMMTIWHIRWRQTTKHKTQLGFMFTKSIRFILSKKIQEKIQDFQGGTGSVVICQQNFQVQFQFHGSTFGIWLKIDTKSSTQYDKHQWQLTA